MLKFKHLRLDQEKIQKVKEILSARTDTEALDMALDRVLLEDRKRLKKKQVAAMMMQLRTKIGKIPDNTADWVRIAREERINRDSRG